MYLIDRQVRRRNRNYILKAIGKKINAFKLQCYKKPNGVEWTEKKTNADVLQLVRLQQKITVEFYSKYKGNVPKKQNHGRRFVSAKHPRKNLWQYMKRKKISNIHWYSGVLTKRSCQCLVRKNTNKQISSMYTEYM